MIVLSSDGSTAERYTPTLSSPEHPIANNGSLDHQPSSNVKSESHRGAQRTPASPTSSTSELPHTRRPLSSPTSITSIFRKRSRLRDDPRRDSGLAPSTSTSATTAIDPSEAHSSLTRITSVPAIVVQDEPSSISEADNGTRLSRNNSAGASQTSLSDYVEGEGQSETKFERISTPIPSGSFDDFPDPENMIFSKRGTMILGKRKSGMPSPEEGRPASSGAVESPVPVAQGDGATEGTTTLSEEEVMLSERVRSMYDQGAEEAQHVENGTQTEQTPALSSILPPNNTPSRLSPGNALNVDRIRPSSAPGGSVSNTAVKRRSVIVREAYETAGGVEDWEDVEGQEVDRYGFIVPRKAVSGDNTNTPRPGELQRMSTLLKLASEAPRRKHTLRRSSVSRSNASAVQQGASGKRSLRPQASLYSFRSSDSSRRYRNPLRYATNRLPQNRGRRWVDEAGDMLTLPPGLADIQEQEDDGTLAVQVKAREWRREEKWLKMAKRVARPTRGGGMDFTFDTKDSKLISRTWKGIPDRWRATAWHAFLSTSAKKRKDSPTDDELIAAFHALQERNSAHDMQIDVDVPRTIGRHIMFRRRYRGGQRLLFRVLHAHSLYVPDTGYVQGMACLAATLLCYYDEEQAFVMLVRLWQLRGLDRLYQAGFEGLMEALAGFEKDWLAGGDVARKLDELGISSTAYGTRWYLTLFNYSIPFPAQLRVWDVFMLLGDAASAAGLEAGAGDLSVLHATSAALIDATREILLDSDFENAMKVLTSWIPVKDEDLLMKVARAEWKAHSKRRRR